MDGNIDNAWLEKYRNTSSNKRAKCDLSKKSQVNGNVKWLHHFFESFSQVPIDKVLKHFSIKFEKNKICWLN